MNRHTEGPPTVFGCALNYVTLRLLGVQSDDEDMQSARKMLQKLGSVHTSCQAQSIQYFHEL